MNLKTQFLSCTSHIINAQLPHVASGNYTEQSRTDMPVLQGELWDGAVLRQGIATLVLVSFRTA